MGKPLRNPALRDFWSTPSLIKVLKGGRSSGKTWDIAKHCIFLASQYSIKFLCLRQIQNRIDQSVYAVLVNEIERQGLTSEFDIQKTTILHIETGSSFHFLGFQKNTEEIKGFEGAGICWIEEGESLTRAQMSIIDPTLRLEGAELWISYNPRLITDYVETIKHDPDNGIIVRQINYDENIYLSETILKKINKLKEDDYEEFEHVYLGKPLGNDDRAIIKRSWVEAAIGAHLKLGIDLENTYRLGFDIADDGKDSNATVLTKGILTVGCEEWQGQEDELLESCTRAYNTALQHKAEIVYDGIGVGATAGSKFKELNEARLEEDKWCHEVEYNKFVAGAKVYNPEDCEEGVELINKDRFSNLKAQNWWSVATRFRNTFNSVTKGHTYEPEELIALDPDLPDLEELITELCQPRKSYDKLSKLKVEGKEDLAKRGVPSPNRADAFIMAYSLEEDGAQGILFF